MSEAAHEIRTCPTPLARHAGVVLGLVVALGYVIPTAGVDAMSPAHPEPMKIFLITGAYHLVGLVMAAVIVTAWRKKSRPA